VAAPGEKTMGFLVVTLTSAEDIALFSLNISNLEFSVFVNKINGDATLMKRQASHVCN